MKRNIVVHALIATLAALTSPTPTLRAADPLINAATEQKSIIPKIPDGGLPPMVGVQNIQVFRASRAAPELTDGKGWTYNHHMDLAQWKGRMYLAWTNGEKDEDVWPSHELYITTEDGITWSKPAELFPQGVSTSLRMYFFHAPNGRMLTLAGLRTGTDKLDEAKKGGAVVREILADHALGPVYTLIDAPAGAKAMNPQPRYETAGDKGFVEACSQLLANHTFLETQDYGTLLGTQRMAAYQNADPDFGKAMSFFHRLDGTLVGIGKRAWTVTSADEGKTWSAPVKPPSIIVGMAKEWVQRTSDGRYVMVYNPSPSDRYPLVATTSNDGITFRDMRVIHGDLAPQRYQGAGRSIGAQYVRGISEWARDDTTIKGSGAKDLWIVYSVNKEDIWVSLIPVPLIPKEVVMLDQLPGTGTLARNWNTYSPKWGGVTITDAGDGTKALTLDDRDPYDFAKAERVFPDAAKVTLRCKFMAKTFAANGALEIELRSAFGTSRPVRLVLSSDDTFKAGATDLGKIIPSQWIDLTITADVAAGTYSVTLNGKTTPAIPFAEPAKSLARLTLRTGPYRTLGDGKFIAPESDKPAEPSLFLIDSVNIE